MNWQVQRFPSLPSTNGLAVEQIRARAARGGEVFVAGVQTAGRGRRGARWLADEGALLCTAVLPTPGAVRLWPWMGLAAALAIAETLRGLGAGAGLKWPNDVVLGGGKVAGVLVEVPGRDLAAVGMGLNVSNPLPAGVPGAATLAQHLPGTIDRDELLALLLGRLDVRWSQISPGEVSGLAAAWRGLDTTPGRQVRLAGSGALAVALGIDPASAALEVETSGGRRLLAQVDEARFVEPNEEEEEAHGGSD